VRSLLECAAAVFPAQVSAELDINKLESFFQERLINLLEAEGKPVTHIMAVLAVDTAEGWSQIKLRLDAVAEFANLPQSQALAAANKRISNILKKIDQPMSAEVDTSLLIEPAEQQLHQQMQRITPLAHDCLTSRDYTGYLKILAGLRDAVDLFFNDVMVNAEDEKIRQNRWALLKQLQTHMNQVADISRLAQ
jgi:glycyl-tRNA synthetase beta chain